MSGLNPGASPLDPTRARGPGPARLLEQRGITRQVDAYVTGAIFDTSGTRAAFATGEGTLHLHTRATGEWTDVQAHGGAILALAAQPDAFLSGGDDGHLKRTTDTTTTLYSQGGRWIEAIATHPNGTIALSAGKRLTLLDSGGETIKTLVHPSTVTGLAFDAKGKRIAASHYNGASLWFVSSRTDTPRVLEWKGSHIAVALHPHGEALVTAMQENALHGWRLSDGHHMRMSGYPSKTLSLSFSRTGRWLATSGAEAIVLWPFFGGGPMGKPPIELAGGGQTLCTRVACHPSMDMLAAGFADGTVLLADVPSQRILPLSPPSASPVSALAWSPDGATLAFGTESGLLALLDLSKR